MLAALSDDQVRLLILEILFKKARESPTNPYVNKEEMLEKTAVPEHQLDFNIYYLGEKGLVRLETAMQGWYMAQITAFGIDVIENKETYKTSFSFINNTIQVHGNNYGNIGQAVNNATVNFNQNITNAFTEAYETIEARASTTAEEKEAIRSNSKLLEEEIRKEEPDAGKIQQLWKWLKQNASWLVPTLSQVVSDALTNCL